MRPDLRNLRRGELLAGVGGLVLLVDLFLHWYRFGIPKQTQDSLHAVTGISAPPNGAGVPDAWTALHVIAPILAVVALLGIAIAVLAATTRVAPLPIAACDICAVIAPPALLLVAYRVIWPPTLGAAGAKPMVHVVAGAYIGLAATAAVAGGAVLALRDERPGRLQRRAPEPITLRLPD